MLRNELDLELNKEIKLENEIELLVYLYSYFSKYSDAELSSVTDKELAISASVNANHITFIASRVKMSVGSIGNDVPFQPKRVNIDFYQIGGIDIPIRLIIDNFTYGTYVSIKFTESACDIPLMNIYSDDEQILQVTPVDLLRGDSFNDPLIII